jgi:hypothetical protein
MLKSIILEIEAFAELLRHPELIKKVKRLAFHVQIHDYLWLTKCAEKIKGQLTALEDLYLVVSIFSIFGAQQCRRGGY